MTREEAIELLENLKVCRQAHTLFNIEKEAVDMAIEALKEQRPHGEWIEHRQFYSVGCFYSEYECSNCHDDVWQKTEWHFCPNCGADMREGEVE